MARWVSTWIIAVSPLLVSLAGAIDIATPVDSPPPTVTPAAIATTDIPEMAAPSPDPVGSCATGAEPGFTTVDVSPLVFEPVRQTGGGYTATTGTVTIFFSTMEGSCGLPHGWEVHVELEPAASGDVTIPAGWVRYLGGVGDTPPWLAPIDAPVTLAEGAPITIATGSGDTGAGGSWTVLFGLQPAVGAAPGRYESRIVVEIVPAS